MPTSSCCALLVQALASQIAFPGSSSYAATEQSYWSTQEASLHPACVFTPQSAQDVSKAVAILGQNSNCTFAIKSQGHAPASGFANIDDGVTIDMTSLRSVSLSSDKQTAHVNTGASWLQVYQYLDQHNVTVAGGRNGQVGVGGLTLGGGISYIGPRVGWACDNVVNFEIALATGELANANKLSNPDLWRALKGGANNFGVVTRIDFQTFPQGEILAGTISTLFSQRKKAYDAFAGLANSTHYDPYAEIVFALSWAPGTGWGNVTSLAAYTKPDPKPAALQPFLNVPDTSNKLHITPISTWADEPPIPVFGEAFWTGTYGVSAALMNDMVNRWDSILNSTATIPGLLAWGFAFEPLPTIFTQYGEKDGGNSLGTSPKDGNAVVLLLSATWNNTASNEMVFKAGRELLDAGNQVARDAGLLHQFEYLNYAGASQNPLASYGAANLNSLRAASKKYDPRGVFQRQVPGGFKLWAAN